MAVSLNGTSQYLQSTGTTITGHPLSWSGWFYFNSLSRFDTLLVIRSSSTFVGFDLRKQTSNKVDANIYNGSDIFARSTSDMTAGTWIHIGAVYASTTSRKIYINGTLEATSTTSAGVDGGANRIVLGAFVGGGGPLSGRIAQVGMWNSALSDANMVSLAGGALPSAIAAANLQNYYKLVSDGTDTQGNNNLTVVGSPTFVSDPEIFTSPTPSTVPVLLSAHRQRRVSCLF
jgi:hypothetical protein